MKYANVIFTMLVLVLYIFTFASYSQTAKPQRYAEVQITLDEKFTLADAENLPQAPDSERKVLDGGEKVIVQTPYHKVKELTESGAELEIVRKFALIETGSDSDFVTDGLINYAYGESDYDVYIENPYPSYTGSAIPFSGNSDLTVTTVDLGYKVRPYAYSYYLYLELTDGDYENYYTLEDRYNHGGNTLIDQWYGITFFQGRPLNQDWVLWASEELPNGSGYIDYWWIKLYYEGDYCYAQSLTCNYEYISRVTCGDIDNTSGCFQYSDYTNLSTEMQTGASYPITVITAGYYSTDECGIWVDWNQDEDFDDAGEEIAAMVNPGDGIYDTTITPPGDATAGDTRMRIRLVDGDYNDLYACGNILYGEVEDYTVTVVSGGPAYGGGTGTLSDPYLIYTAEHLQTLGATPEHWDKNFKLMADIDLAGYTGEAFNIIGVSQSSSFSGTFNGNDHIICNFNYETSGYLYTGLFGCVSGSGARIENLSLIEPDVNASNTQIVGALAGMVIDAEISQCDVQGGRVCGADTQVLGGLVGRCERGIISDCYSSAEVEADDMYGGLIGYVEFGTVSRCYAAGRVIWSQPQPYAVGGLIGFNDSGTYNSCFWDFQACGITKSYGGTGKTTKDMYQQSTYTGWDFSTPIWLICDGWDYPYMARPGIKYAGGNGTADNPYLIRNSCQFQEIGTNPGDWNKHFELIADINLVDYPGELFNIIGAFLGVFDGDGHSISGFNYSYTGATQDTIGIFSQVYGLSSKIKNLVIIDPVVDSGAQGVFTASLAGELRDGTISNCHVRGGSITGDTGFGLAGLVGNMFDGTIENCDCNIVVTSTNGQASGIVGGMWSGTSPIVSGCIFRGQVSGNDGAGGIVGENYGTIEYCQVSGEVTAQQQAGGITGENHGIIRESFCDGQVTAIGSEAGGITGRNFDDIIDCYSTADVTAVSQAGGAVGLNWMGNVNRCYAAGAIGGSGGGLIGDVIDGNTFDSFWDIEISGKSYSAGGTGLPTEQMYKQSTFNSVGWDFGSTWKICEDITYPKLQWERYGGGDGSPNNPCLICNAEEMKTIGAHREDWDKHFRLASDIDMSAYTGTQYNLIGWFRNGDDVGRYFSGSFDGDYHSIYNFTYTATNKQYGVGLFGWLASKNGSTLIKNLTLVEPNIDVGSGGDTGALVGIWSFRGNIYNCHVINGTIRGDGALGGLVGSGFYGSYDKCSASVDIVATSGTETLSGIAGGLVGINNFGPITRCYSSGSVVSDGDVVGGLCGMSGGDMNDCYSTTSVDGNEFVGGLIGYSSGQIKNCYSAGPVSGNGVYVNGLIGTCAGGPVENCFWDVDTSGQAGPGPGTGLTTEEMQDADTFIAAGWDFVHERANGANDIWRLCEDNYAKFAWQLDEYDFACPDGTGGEDFAYLCEQWLMEKCYLDIAPDEGDGFVDFLDYSVFANSWLTEAGQGNYNPVCDVWPIGGDGKVDEQDAGVFMDEWLRAGLYYLNADIAPSGQPDGIVNFLDYAAFCADWITQINP